MRKKTLDYILETRESTIGHWRFRNNSNDDVSSANTLLSVGTFNAEIDFINGYSENGITAINLNGDNGLYLGSPASDNFNFLSTEDFTIEAIVKIDNDFIEVKPIIEKWDGVFTGFRLVTHNSGAIHIRIGDTINTVAPVGSILVNDGRWHHIAMIVDRTNDEMFLYIDGVVDINALDISSITGDISTTNNVVVGLNYEGLIDEICITKERITALAILDRANGQFNLVDTYQENFMMNYLPSVNHTNADLLQFLIPFNTLFLDTKQLIDKFDWMIHWDKVESKFMNNFASTLGIEYPDESIITGGLERFFIRNAVLLYQKKGTINCVENFCLLMGFIPTIVEEFDSVSLFILNTSRLWSQELGMLIIFSDDFSSPVLNKWNTKQTSADVIFVSNEKMDYFGGTPGVSETNGITFDNTSDNCIFKVKFDIQPDSTAVEFGFYLNFIDYNNFIYAIIKKITGKYWMIVGKVIAGVDTPFSSVQDIDDIITDIEDEHEFWVRADMQINPMNFSAGIDDVTLIADEVGNISDILTMTSKGVYVVDTCHMLFDDVIVRNFDITKPVYVLAVIGATTRNIIVTLFGTPDNINERENYLRKVLPNYIPAGVDLTVV